MSEENVVKRHPKIEIGQRFNMLVIVADEGTDSHGNRSWLCRCDCGNVKSIKQCSLRYGQLSCRCIAGSLIAKARTKHGHCPRNNRRPEYNVWTEMIRRCHNPKSNRYALYGARGISVCERWRGVGGYIRFIADMGERPSQKHSIDRIDNDQGYNPGNCRWATQGQQMSNTRSSRFLTFMGKTQTYRQWAREFGLSSGSISRRVKLGWSVERTLTTKRRKSHATA